MSNLFDPAKDTANTAKHGISLMRASELDLASAIVRPDVRRDDGEPRWLAYGILDNRLHVLVFAMRDGSVRPISLRKANARERKRYG